MVTFLRNIRKSALLLMAVLPLVGQTGLGVVQGTIRDASGANIPNAKISLTDTATGVARTTEANGAGIYYFGSVQIGPYRMAVTANGFKVWETSFELEAGQNLAVDAALTVGSIETKVEVTAAASQITTEGAQLSDVKTALEIHDLPLNGRQVTNLFTLTPGVEGGQNTQGGANPRVNGMMVGGTEMLLDGMSYVNRFGGGINQVQPGLDTIQEYRVETSGSGAELDRPSTIELVTRSGSNQFHGAAFETLRDNYGGLVARAVSDGNTPAKLIRNEFGGYLGGPVIKNKTFFFYDQEYLRQRQEIFAQTAVPTAAMWGGDFSNETDTSGDKYTIYNPYSTTASGTRTPFPNNQIPASLLNTQLTNGFRNISPVPSGPNASANPWVGYNFQTYYPKNTNTSTYTGRVDQTFSQKDTLYGRFTKSGNNYVQAGDHYGYPAPGITDATGSSTQNTNVYSIVLHETHLFSPSLLNDLQLAATRSANASGTGADGINWDSKLGLPNPFGAKGWPTVYTDAYNMFYYGGWDADNHKAQDLTQYQIDDNVSWVKGKHQFKFGFKGRMEYSNVEELQQAQGSEYFDSWWTGEFDPSANGITPFTGSGLASLEMGLPSYLSNEYNRGFFYFQQKEIGMYGQDTWRVTPKLTVSLGLRWEFWTPYKEKYNRIDNVDLNSLSPTSMQVVLPYNTTLNTIPGLPTAVIDAWSQRGLTGVSANSIGFPGALIPNVWRDFSPHAALAYRLSDKWVVRGGYGMFYFPMPLSQLLQNMRLNPPLNLVYQNNVDVQQGNNGVYALTVVPASSDILGGNGTATVSPAAVSSSAQGILALDPKHWADNRTQEWTVSLERELIPNLILKLAYSGNHGSDLQQHWDYNAPTSKYNYQAETGMLAPSLAYLRQLDPNWTMTGQGGVLEHNGYSNANTIQATIEKRFSNGLSFQAFYAYTHMMTTTDAGGFTAGGGSINANATGSGSQGGGTSGTVPAQNEILGNPTMTDSQRLRLLYTNSSQVPPQRITWNGVYQLPVGRNRRFLSNSNRAVDAALGGWQVAFIGTWDGGFWMGVNSGEYLYGNPALGSGKHLDLTYNGQNQLLWFAGDFDPTQATNVNLQQLEALVPVNRANRLLHPAGPGLDNLIAQTLANGTTVQTNITDNVSWNARNFMLGPSAWNQDLSVSKYFSIVERLKLRLSGDFFNAFNHPTLNNPDPTTGLINLSSQANSPRIIQLGARIEF